MRFAFGTAPVSATGPVVVSSLGVRLALAALSAVLLNFAFPVAGPMPPMRAVLSMVALLPMLVAVIGAGAARAARPLREAALCGYTTGALWYGMNCYWIYATMHQYGGLPPWVSAGIVVLFSLILGLYFALFALLAAFVRKATGRLLFAACAVPCLWIAVEYLAAHFTCVPWDQLGYSQVDNLVLTRLAPWTGVYGLSWVLAGVNAVWLGSFYARTRRRQVRFAAGALVLTCGLQAGSLLVRAPEVAGAEAVLLQPNLRVGAGTGDENDWVDRPGDPEWSRHTAEYLRLSGTPCTPYLLGMPEPVPIEVRRECWGPARQPTIVAWPESPSPFRAWDPRFALLLQQLRIETLATTVVGAPAVGVRSELYNAAVVTRPNGTAEGQYAKIHLVPWGEYVPFKRFFKFAGTLTQNVGRFDPGTERTVFALPDGHRMSIFICYEAVFASEIRLFAKNGAEVFVNISDDGWYGDTSAPWQHLNMARMRAIENNRWIVRDTNSGVTAAIDPLGRVTESVGRHKLTALTADYGYRTRMTVYTRWGDWFAWLCEILSLGGLGFVGRRYWQDSVAKRQV
ncbi:apolipoprotein N-acyltransferase [Acidipila sp. EB88]|uniref:apolipoprotein N-acyltransferase n=1 Tax=Acidipila sp. EB88 TaxID=2305226 RepID=UPI00131527E1|nr:apolipoprotein N-acyltransferase [Acidipila sp. EB88]